jgi:hypothetical protein
MALRITIAFSDNPRLDPLTDGTVKPQGIDLDFVTVEPGALFYRNLVYDEFDASEMSISEIAGARAQRRHEMGLIGAADILEPRTPLAQSLCQHGLGHRRSGGRPPSARGARFRYHGGIVITDHANALGATR